MAKKTLSTILQCPTDFLYLWASDEFISQLGSKARIISEKKYYQYQSLWKTMVENTSSNDPNVLQQTYQSWTDQIAAEIKNIYGITPSEILVKLAMGQPVLGKNWNEGVYGGIGKTKVSFDQSPNVTVDAHTGKIMKDYEVLPNQTPIYGSDGTITGYSCLISGAQYQSNMGLEGMFGAYAYSDENVVQTPNKEKFNASAAGFWENTENYMPIIDKVLAWIDSLLKTFAPNQTKITKENTLPKQTEWVDESSNGGLVAGGLALAALVLVSMEKPKGYSK